MSAAMVAGYSITGRDGRVWVVNQYPDGDPYMTAMDARLLAVALCSAADHADRDTPHAGKEQS